MVRFMTTARAASLDADLLVLLRSPFHTLSEVCTLVYTLLPSHLRSLYRLFRAVQNAV